MTLGGLAAAVGLIIDDAIVVVENIVVHRDHGESIGDAISKALREIRTPLVGSTITPIVVFIPLMAVSGVTGTFFRALAITVGVALLTSLVLALTWTPALSSLLLKRQGKHREESGVWMTRLIRVYQKSIRFSLAHPWMLGASCILLVAASWLCYSRLGSDLLPSMDEGGFILDYLTPAGASLKDTNEILIGVEQILHDIPEVESTSRRTEVDCNWVSQR